MKSKLINILWITVAWTFISLYQYMIAYSFILQFGLEQDEDLETSWLGGLVTGVIAGLIGGTVLVFFWERWLRSKPYGWTIRNILLSFTSIFILISCINNTLFLNNFEGMPIGDMNTWLEAFYRTFELSTLIPFTSWLLIVLVTLIVFLVNDKYGPGVFIKFLMGKYFNPKKEERVFMFMDLRSSTTIAEQLGEETYFNFIRDVYKEATPGILAFKGEIYQYVGDEVVVSWPYKSGIENGNCINCYFEVKKLLHSKEGYFKEKYGVVPEFKAGLHYGTVMAGEIGIVKRDIAYSGDVLNTTSRIQELCNSLKVDVLLSNDLIQKLNISKLKLQVKSLGEVNLRGKAEKVELFSI
ncbi:MAG: adenylate/guanylate cyclase domain-containing protein [Bacteroidota bacterium]